MSAAVDNISAPVVKMAIHWPMTEALMGGTAVMRAAGQRFLPKFPKEEAKAWETRLALATLFPAFRRTVHVMAGKPFSKPLTLSKDTDPKIKEWCEDVDREGASLHVFAADMFTEMLAHGLCGIHVESPKSPVGDRPMTIAEEKAAGIRPYMVRIMHDQILGWQSASISGRTILTMLRLKDDTSEPDGLYGERTVRRVRVLRPGSWEVWRQTERPDRGDEWVLAESGTTGLTYIPFVPLYGSRSGFMSGGSPLLDVAYLNVKHWQSQSDQDNILHMARVPILACVGGDPKNVITIGSSSAVNVPMGGDLKFVEHSGKAIEAGQKSLGALEGQMIQSGAELLVKTPGTRTATESAGDIDANKSELQRLAEDLEDALDHAIDIMQEYAGITTDSHVTVFKDFGAFSLAAASGQLILSMQQAGVISKETTIEEQKRRGELGPEVDADLEAERVAAEGLALGLIPPESDRSPAQIELESEDDDEDDDEEEDDEEDDEEDSLEYEDASSPIT